MIDLKATPPDVELAWRRFEQSLREENERRERALDEQHRQLLKEMSARYADISIFKPPPEMLSVLSPEETARIEKLLHDVERALESLSPELQDAFWNLPLADGFFDAVASVLNPKLTDKQRATELATFFARGEVETLWLQLRRALYPVVKDLFILANVIEHIHVAFLKDDDFQKGATIFVVLLAIIYFLGVPDGEKSTRKNK